MHEIHEQIVFSKAITIPTAAQENGKDQLAIWRTTGKAPSA
jgi:hypothetical protein